MLNAACRLSAEDPIRYPEEEGPLDAYSRSVAAVVDGVGPAVVRVESVVQGRRAGVGSGVIIAGDGLVLTNSHVIGGAKHVRLSIAMGGEAEAQLLGDDLDTDLALLRSELVLPENSMHRKAEIIGIIESDVGDPARARNACRRPVQVAVPCRPPGICRALLHRAPEVLNAPKIVQPDVAAVMYRRHG